MKLSEFVSNYLAFTRKDRIGILVLIVLIVAIYLLPTFLHRHITTAKADSSWISAVKKLEQPVPATDEPYRQYADENSSNYQYDRPAYSFPGKSKGELFYFDPNTMSAEEWTRLGLREKTIHTIQNYLSKGGHFKKPEDLQRVYGLFPDEYERIAPYIRIAAKEESNSDNGFTSNKTFASKSFTPKYTAVDINTADTSALIALPGIGSKLAARIIGFREKLGGFYSVAQVGETYGLPDSTFQKLKQYFELRTNSIKKININAASLEELKSHPYIRWNLANPIVAYRKEHGSFAKVDDLKKIMAITDDIFNKISPYLTVQ